MLIEYLKEEKMSGILILHSRHFLVYIFIFLNLLATN